MEPSSVAVVNQIAKVYLSNNFAVTSFVVRGRTECFGYPFLNGSNGDTQIAVTATTTTKTSHRES